MGAAKKIYDEIVITPANQSENDKGEVPSWKKKKSSREKLIRAIRSKGFTESIRTVIRSEIKKNGNTEEEK